ncbi:hypothetical protein [uncultured Comamonas sp.]|uniref:hypothetical protein n=1 Tax=uncultured Comamonas sp. TaxID=114710 RepID=UPI0025E77E4F|nr:hypothetical protein [uncultured Comamonas sp.]
MGFWSSLGGVISTVSNWAKEAVKPIANVVKKVGSWMKDVGQITEAHLEGKNIIMDEDFSRRSIPLKRKNNNDLIWDEEDQLVAERQSILIKIEDQNSKILAIDRTTKENQNQTKLQLEVIELIIASQTIGRFAANIQLHEANLRIHHQSIQNSVGMLDSINRQRVGIKALFSQVNKIILSLDSAGINRHGATLIKDIDVDPRPGAISISNAYAAFDETVSLLYNEAEDFIHLTDRQIERALKVKAMAANVPSKQRRIEDWIDRSVIPSLRHANKSTHNLLLSLNEIPQIGNREQIQSIGSYRGNIEEQDD